MYRNNAKEEILQATQGGLDVFRHFLPGIEIPSSSNFRSPFYEDGKASCNVFQGRDGLWRYHDFGEGGFYQGDCFWLVGMLYGLDNRQQFPDILHLIISEMRLPIQSPKNSLESAPKRVKRVLKDDDRPRSVVETASKEYSYKTKTYSDTELAYWQQYGIGKEELTKYMVYSLESFSSVSRAGKPYTLHSRPNDPMFMYFLDDKSVKVYRPFNKFRFLSGGVRNDEYIFGLWRLTEKNQHLIITGGEKDVMTLSARGFNAVSLNSETAKLSPEKAQELKDRFGDIFICYDRDETGVLASKRLQEEFRDLHFKVIELPLSGNKEEKDVSDYFRLGKNPKDFFQLMELATLSEKITSRLDSEELWKLTQNKNSSIANIAKEEFIRQQSSYYQEVLPRICGEGINPERVSLVPEFGYEEELTRNILIDGQETGLYHFYEISNKGKEIEYIARKGFDYCNPTYVELESHCQLLSEEKFKGRLYFNGATYVGKTLSDFLEFEKTLHQDFPEYYVRMGVQRDTIQLLQSIATKSSIISEAEQSLGKEWKESMCISKDNCETFHKSKGIRQ